jgi:hypothetical protein
MRDYRDNFVVFARLKISIPWAYTGDSITVAPAQTLLKGIAGAMPPRPSSGSWRRTGGPGNSHNPENGRMTVVR